mmetsp:Transcript_3372/g.4727  ORF Transcript_3372/g.4727 Transcript_3372/m.4727 type:complete len:84 (+) Transcript_3372:417-668(+)
MKTHELIEFFDKSNNGLLITMLGDIGGQKNHCIGIDTNHSPTLIYDCTHSYAMKFWYDNLHKRVNSEHHFLKFLTIGKVVVKR